VKKEPRVSRKACSSALTAVTVGAVFFEFPAEFPAAGVNEKKWARRNLMSRRALLRRGDWIRTSDLLNPIQGQHIKRGLDVPEGELL
jgi:hypothetical protein